MKREGADLAFEWLCTAIYEEQHDAAYRQDARGQMPAGFVKNLQETGCPSDEGQAINRREP